MEHEDVKKCCYAEKACDGIEALRREAKYLRQKAHGLEKLADELSDNYLSEESNMTLHDMVQRSRK